MSAPLRILWITCIVGCHLEPGLPTPVAVDASIADAPRVADGPSEVCDLSGTPLDVDLLFVIGNGERSAVAKAALFNGLELFMERLECELGARPNLHAGVISTNMGAGGFDIPRCSGNGDDGVLLDTPQRPDCVAPDGAFLSDTLEGEARTRNYSGEIFEALECIGRLPESGCTFEQPLAAAIRATDGTTNPGFLRPQAVLGIVIASGGDDCSPASDQLFNPDSVDTLGPLSPFRCFEQGVQCDPDDPRSIGDKMDCAPRAGGLVAPALDLAATLISRKADPNDVVIATIGGIPTDVTVARDGDSIRLASSCPSPLEIAPPVRLSAVSGDNFALACLPSPSNLAPLAEAIAAAALD